MNGKPTAAIIGASADRKKFGNKSLRAHVQADYEVYPIHPKADEIEGLKAYPSVKETGVAPFDRVALYLPPALAVGVMPEVAEVGCGQLWLSPGCDTPEVVDAAYELNLPVVIGCSIVDLGVTPAEFPDE